MKPAPLMILAVAAVACAPRGRALSPVADARDCFDASRVSGWESVGPSRIRVRVSGTEGYDLGLDGPQCVDVVWSPSIGIESNLGSPWVCVGEGVGLGEVRFQDGPAGRTVTCRIASVSRPE